MELNYKQFGTGEPVIILHGLFGMLDNWQNIAKKLASGFEVFILDQRNHGKSPHADEHNYAVMARDLYDFLEEQNIFSTHIIGHSMGGKVAMQFAAFYPGFVKKLVIADMFPKSYTESRLNHEKIFEAIDFIQNCRFSNRLEGQEKLKEIINNDRIFLFILKNLKVARNGCPEWKFNSRVLKNEYENMLVNIQIHMPVKAPALFLKASDSSYISEDEFESVYTFFPHAELRTIPDTTHWLHADKPDEFVDEVKEFLTRHE